MWGESAVPYYVLGALELACSCKSGMSEALIIQLLQELASYNGPQVEGRGLPNIYYSPEDAVKLNSGLDFLNDEVFVGHSYTLAPLVEILARKWRRQALASIWFRITRIASMNYIPASSAEFFRWRSSEGTLETHFAGEPQSWEQLRTAAETFDVSSLPASLIARPEFALWFILVYPHRFSRQVSRLLEAATYGG
jgi:hypothetical protein